MEGVFRPAFVSVFSDRKSLPYKSDVECQIGETYDVLNRVFLSLKI